MKKTNLFGLLFMCFAFMMSTSIHAQSKVSGTVTDGDSGEALIGANILIKGTVSGTITDFDGKYELTVKQEPPYMLEFSLVGYGSQTLEVSQSEASLDVNLVQESIMANEVVVSASRVEESILQSPVTIEKLDQIAIKQSASADYYDEIAKIKGVQTTTASLTFNSVNARGFGGHGNTRFVQLQDGMDNASALLNFPSGNIVGISELDINNVELIPGAASALYGPNAFNGILLMTSKDPFRYQGLSAQLKGGITESSSTDPFYGASIRWADAINDKFAYKFNVSGFFASDWEANDYTTHRTSASGEQIFSVGDPAFDGLNLYGDEAAIGPLLTGLPETIRRSGISEEELLESRDANSIKLDAALHYRLTDNIEASFSYKWGQGSGVYQGSERYALRDFVQQFMKFELNSSNWNIRAYSNVTDDGDSYNMTALGAFANEALFPSLIADADGNTIGGWVAAYVRAYTGFFEAFGIGAGDHDVARAFADGGGFSGLPAEFGEGFVNILMNSNGLDEATARTVLGAFSGTANRDRNGNLTPEAESAIEDVRNGLFQQGGAGFIDDSKVYHVEGNYDFTEALDGKLGLQVGANFRRYDLFTDGTVFNEDPDGDGTNERIGINEYGAYVQASKNIGENLKLQGSLRYDKNQNFDGQISPRISAVYSMGENKNHNFRASFQTGFRNPTNQGQYIYFPTTNILLGGTRDNAERYGIYEGGAYSDASYQAFLASGGDESLLVEQFLEYVQPEKLQVIEVGYKGITNNKLMLDINAYYNTYNDFITQNIVRNKEATSHKGTPISALSAWNPYFNAPVTVNSYGLAIGTEYIVSKNWKISGNYAYDDFILDEDELPQGFEQFNPGFNTSNHKLNIGVSNRKFAEHFSAGINMRYQSEFEWFGSFGSGTIDAFATIDAQIGYKIPNAKTTVKLGVNNILKNEYRTNYGAPYVGRMVHLTLTYDQFSN